VTQLQAVRSRRFNVRSRAANPDPRNVLYSADPRKRLLAQQHGVTAINRAVSLINSYDCEQETSREKKTPYLLVGYGNDFLYFSPGPLIMRGPRTRAARGTNRAFAEPPTGDDLVIEVEYTEPVTGGLTSPSRDTAMGGSARNYAASVMDREWANARTWEWLHIVGHALGGNNEVGNLVAGTFDANSAMIPHEAAVRNATNLPARVTVKYEVALYPDTWLAIDITMTYSFIGPNGFTFVSQNFPAQTDIQFDKLQYDIWQLG